MFEVIVLALCMPGFLNGYWDHSMIPGKNVDCNQPPIRTQSNFFVQNCGE